MEIKEAKDLLSLRWEKVTDWEDLIPTTLSMGKIGIGVEDVEIFVESKCNDIARSLQLPKADVKKLIKDENELFYRLKGDLFAHATIVSTEQETIKFERLKRIFRFPKIE